MNTSVSVLRPLIVKASRLPRCLKGHFMHRWAGQWALPTHPTVSLHPQPDTDWIRTRTVWFDLHCSLGVIVFWCGCVFPPIVMRNNTRWNTVYRQDSMPELKLVLVCLKLLPGVVLYQEDHTITGRCIQPRFYGLRLTGPAVNSIQSSLEEDLIYIQYMLTLIYQWVFTPGRKEKETKV